MNDFDSIPPCDGDDGRGDYERDAAIDQELMDRADGSVMDAISERQWAETMADLDRDWRL